MRPFLLFWSITILLAAGCATREPLPFQSAPVAVEGRLPSDSASQMPDSSLTLEAAPTGNDPDSLLDASTTRFAVRVETDSASVSAGGTVEVQAALVNVGDVPVVVGFGDPLLLLAVHRGSERVYPKEQIDISLIGRMDTLGAGETTGGYFRSYHKGYPEWGNKSHRTFAIPLPDPGSYGVVVEAFFSIDAYDHPINEGLLPEGVIAQRFDVASDTLFIRAE